MIRRISRNEDLIDTIKGDVRSIKTVNYYTQSNPNIKVHPNEEFVDDETLVCRICSEDLKLLPTGQLVCEIEMEQTDAEFCDGKYNTTNTYTFDIWLD